MSTIERAIALAAVAHAGQFDKGGQPYIFHPLRLMLAVQGPIEQMAAVLHDVVEDTALTLADLRAEGFAGEVVDAVEALTKREGETRIQAAQRAAANRVARAVKLADVNDNMNLSRIANPSDEDRARLIEYAVVRDVLLGADPR